MKLNGTHHETVPVKSSSRAMNSWQPQSSNSFRHGTGAGSNSTPLIISRLRSVQETFKAATWILMAFLLTSMIWATIKTGVALTDISTSMQILAREAAQRNNQSAPATERNPNE